MSEETHTLTPLTLVHQTVEWLRWRGYRAAPAITPGAQVPGGIVFSRKNQPVLLAQVGDVLVWDGQNVKVKED